MIAGAARKRTPLPPWVAASPGVDVRSRLTVALQDAGLDLWSAAQHKDCPYLITIELAATAGYVWLRPHFTQRFAQIALPVGDALAALERAAVARLDAGGGASVYATEDEALAVWDVIVAAAVEAGL